MERDEATSDAGGTPGLLKCARAEGSRDVYGGKRDWVRYNLGVRIEVATDPTIPATAWGVSLHNVSGGGVGFWSKRSLSTNTVIHIKDQSEDGQVVWLSARVTHCTVGLRGYLVGASFAEPGAADEENDWQEAGNLGDKTPRVGGSPGESFVCSVRIEYAFATASASVVGVLLAGGMVWYLGWSRNLMLSAALAGVSAACLGGVCGWLIAGREARFLKSLHAALGALVGKASQPSKMAEAPSRELGAIRRAVVDLAARWSKHEDDERIQRQKLEELTQIKSNILAIVSHDLRTPLTSILMYARMLTEDLETLSAEDQRGFLEIISEECTRLSRLVDDLLEVQRLESRRIEWNFGLHDLSETVRYNARVFEGVARSKSMELTVDCPRSLPKTWADPDRITQVLSNLLSNAIKYTPAGGKVKLSGEVRGQELVFRVADNGLGIPRDKWDHIFDRFSQLSDPNVGEVAGVGLGLYIVRKMVEGHGGVVWVDSVVGEGCEFYVALPIVSSGIESPTAPASGSPARRVVVCDADPELAARTAQTLHAENFDVRIAHSGYRLLSHLDHGDVEVVVTDIALPDMNGLDLLDALNNVSNRSFGMIIHSFEDDDQEFGRRGVDIFLKRPVSKVELVEAVRVAIQKRSTAGRTVVLVNDGQMDLRRLETLLSGSGHLYLVAQTVGEGSRLTRHYRVDAVIIPRACLNAASGMPEDLRAAAANGTRVIVLCDTVRRKERQLEEQFGVVIVACQSGQEEKVVDAVLDTAEPIEAGTIP